LTATIRRLLPGSIVDTPSIMKLFDPPPVESEFPILLPPLTPGVRSTRAAKLRLAMGRLLTASVATVNERSPVVD
jgi:hypothetical protein